MTHGGRGVRTAGPRRVREDFIGDRHLIQYVDLFDELLAP
jgi:hypothetical protein